MKKKKSKIKTTRKALKLQIFMRKGMNNARTALTWIGFFAAVIIVLARWLP